MEFDLFTIIATILGFLVATFGAKWGLKKIIMGTSKWAKALNPVAKEMDQALTVIGQAAEDGDLTAEELKQVFTESKDVWDAIKNVDDLTKAKQAAANK